MFGLGQEISLEGFGLLLKVFLPIELSSFSKNRAISRNSINIQVRENKYKF